MIVLQTFKYKFPLINYSKKHGESNKAERFWDRTCV